MYVIKQGGEVAKTRKSRTTLDADNNPTRTLMDDVLESGVEPVDAGLAAEEGGEQRPQEGPLLEHVLAGVVLGGPEVVRRLVPQKVEGDHLVAGVPVKQAVHRKRGKKTAHKFGKGGDGNRG